MLLNPVIAGNINVTSEATTDLEAAHEIWKNLSKHINNNIPRFLFTLQKGGELSHFMVKEKKLDNEVAYSIDKIQLKNNSVNEKKCMNKAIEMSNKLKHISSGGKRRKKKSRKDDSSSSSSSSDDEDLKYHSYLKYRRRDPLYYWWYTPTFYQPTYKYTYIPTFKYVYPYIEYWTGL